MSKIIVSALTPRLHYFPTPYPMRSREPPAKATAPPILSLSARSGHGEAFSQPQ